VILLLVLFNRFAVVTCGDRRGWKTSGGCRRSAVAGETTVERDRRRASEGAVKKRRCVGAPARL